MRASGADRPRLARRRGFHNQRQPDAAGAVPSRIAGAESAPAARRARRLPRIGETCRSQRLNRSRARQRRGKRAVFRGVPRGLEEGVGRVRQRHIHVALDRRPVRVRRAEARGSREHHAHRLVPRRGSGQGGGAAEELGRRQGIHRRAGRQSGVGEVAARGGSRKRRRFVPAPARGFAVRQPGAPRLQKVAPLTPVLD